MMGFIVTFIYPHNKIDQFPSPSLSHSSYLALVAFLYYTGLPSIKFHFNPTRIYHRKTTKRDKILHCKVPH